MQNEVHVGINTVGCQFTLSTTSQSAGSHQTNCCTNATQHYYDVQNSVRDYAFFRARQQIFTANENRIIEVQNSITKDSIYLQPSIQSALKGTEKTSFKA